MLRQTRGLLRSLVSPRCVPRRHVTKDLGHVKKPYEPVHHETYPAGPPLLFGRKPGDPLEGWEIMTISTFLLSVGIVLYGSYAKDSDDFLVCAISLTLTVHILTFFVLTLYFL